MLFVIIVRETDCCWPNQYFWCDLLHYCITLVQRFGEQNHHVSSNHLSTHRTLYLRTTYFEFQEAFIYEQVDGAAMGSPFCSVIASIYMEGFKKEAVDTAADQPSPWLRYVNGTFVIWPHGPDKLKSFHSHLNSLRKSIQFTITIEKEQDNHLPFLDVLVTKEGNHMTTSIYRKKMHTDRYLHL